MPPMLRSLPAQPRHAFFDATLPITIFVQIRRPLRRPPTPAEIPRNAAQLPTCRYSPSRAAQRRCENVVVMIREMPLMRCASA